MKNILYVLHSGITGGTFLTNKDLMKNICNDFNIFLLNSENDFLNLFKYVNHELVLLKKYPRHIKYNCDNIDFNKDYKWSAKEFHNSWLTYIYFDILTTQKIDIVHIRHLINHSFDLPQISKKLNIPVVLSIHDFYFICPFYTLLDENNHYCAGKCSDNNISCYSPLNSLNDINSKEIISQWRHNVLDMFSFVDIFITTSNFVKDLFLSVYDNGVINKNNFKVIEHGRDFPKFNKTFFEYPSKNNPIKILCPANHLNIMKGSELIKSIKNEDVDNLIEFHFLGNCHDSVENYGVDHGTFDRDEFYKEIDKIKPSFIGIFSIWPETFCHTITEAWSCGIPVIGSNIGVIQDRILKNSGGWVIDINDSKRTYKKILDIAYGNNNEKDDSYETVLSNINNLKFKSTKEMSDEYKVIYDFLL